MGPTRRLLALLAFGLLAGCLSRGCAPAPEGSHELLLDRIAVAEKIWEGRLIEFGSPQALPLLGSGWSYGEVASDGGSFRWAVAETASFRLESDRRATELAFLECEPFLYEGGPAQWVRLVVNGWELAPLELRPGRVRYPLQLPLALGENEIELRFRYAGEPSRARADKRRLAVAFYRLEVPFQDFRHRVGAFDWVEPERGEPGIFLPSGGSLSFFLELPRPSRLRFTLGAEDPVPLRASSGDSITVSIRAETGEVFREIYAVEDGGREVFEREIGAVGSSPVEVTLTAGESSVLLRPEIFVPLEQKAPDVVPEPAALPNIVLLVLDGANALRMGLYGHDEETTPFTDALGGESVVFDVAVTQAVYTIASIGSILTGQYPERHQSVSFADRLRDDVVTFPAILSQAGYRTAAFPGNAVVSRTFGLDRGYEEFVPVWERDGYSGHGDSVVRSFRSWLDLSSGEPFFAYVHFREPHFPYDPPPPFDTRFGPGQPFPGGIQDSRLLDELNRQAREGSVPEEALERIEGLYQGNLAYADSLVGEVLAAIEPLDRPTVVILTADHGEAIFEHGFLGHNTQLYEESVRVPLLIRAPGVAPRRVESVVELIDLTPTILDLAGLAAHPAKSAMQGRSLTPLLLGGETGDRSRIAFSRTVWARPRYSARNERFKLIWNSDSGETELYDLMEDPGERVDLAGSSLVVEGFLKQELFGWLRNQERLKSKEPSPEGAVISEEERRMLESLGYADHVPRRKRKESER